MMRMGMIIKRMISMMKMMRMVKVRMRAFMMTA